MKKTYILPAATAVAFTAESALLGASGPSISINSGDDAKKDGSAACSNEQGWSSEGWAN